MAKEQTNESGEGKTKKWNMKETLRHIEAFEYYYSLGAKRDLLQVGLKFSVSETSAKKWSVAFDWQKRIEERDHQNAQSLALKTDKLLLKTREDYRKEIQDSLKIIRAALMTVIEGLRDKKIKAKNISDIDRLMSAQDKMARLDLTLMGELPEGDVTKAVRFSFAPPVGHDKKQEKNKNGVDGGHNADKIADED